MSAMVKRRKRLSIDEDRAEPEREEMSYLNTAASQLSWGLLQRLSGRLEDGEEEREERSQSRVSPRQSNSAEQTGALWSSSEISRIKRTMHNGKTTNIKSWLLMALLAGSLLALGSLTRAGDAPGRRLPAGADSERQLQLLRSANVELSRSRGQRHQRDTPSSAEPTAITATAPTCGYPGSPAHASVTFNTSHVVAGTAASYTCDNGYELLGPPRRLCQANGTWSPVGIPFCVLNVGLGKAAMQSSTVGPGSAQKAVDGSTSPYFQISTCTETDAEHNPWWYVNLLEPYLVQIVRIDFGRACCGNRQKATIAVRVGNNRPDLGNNPLCNRYHGFIEEGKPLFLPCTRPAPGAFVSIHLESPSGFQLSICETFIYTDHEQCPSFRDQPLGSTATYNGKCYLFHNNQALNFDGARKYCESRGGTLVDETSPALQGFLSWELYRRHRTEQTNGQYWLGAVRDSRNPQLWKWINGKEVQISFWNSVAQQGNCSRFDGNKGWLWTDTDCNQKLNFICQYRPLSCGKPEKPTNSTLITRNIDNGTVIEYQCAPGNLLMGPKSRACLPTGFFSEFAPKCKYLDCQFPAMIPNGDYKLLNGTTSYQSVVSYFCQEGYQIYGKPVLSCDVDERWNGPPPRCEPMLCPAVQAPSNGYITVTQKINMPGTQATYECRPGYELVGDQLLTCLPSGSWDNSFPYCREKRPLLPPVQLGVSTSSTPATPSNPSTTALAPSRPAQRPSGGLRPSSAVQFPTGTNTPFSSNRLPAGPPASTTNAPTPTQPPSTNSMPASLNGIASQFNQQSPATSSVNINDQLTSTGSPVTPAADQQQTRKAAQSNSVSQFALPPSGSQSFVELSPTATSPSSALPTESSNQRSVSKSTTTATTFNTMAGQPTTTGATSPNNNIRQQQATSPANKFTYGSPSSTAFDSSPLATTNSISVHQQQQQQQTPSSTLAPSFTLSSMPSGGRAVPTNQNVLASFSPPVRAHNTLAGAKYSLDGIIAVAIFGGFIFLGAIITIIVIIIRRRKSNHSAIDAQTISTYDSNGEHNGLYRNYQQAWENLRFASPANQPKSSGGGQGGGLLGGNGTGLITAHVNGGPSVGLKNFASPTVHMIHHAHQLQHPHHHHAHHNPLLQGHHNLAMAQSASSSSSQDGSSVMDDQTQVGVNPLLRNPNNQGVPNQQHRAHHHHHHSHSQLARRSMVVEDEDEVDTMLDDADEQGVLSTDESNYRPISGDHQQQAGEGFRDTNELTIEAEQVLNGSGARRRLYSASNPVGGGQSRVQNRPLSMASVAHGHHHHHHHHHHGSSGGSSQHQRLVGSSTPSTSTRSSRASPPSDDQSLERLAYGTNWHQATGNQNNSGSGSSQDQTSGGSSASILGPNASRSNLRYN